MPDNRPPHPAIRTPWWAKKLLDAIQSVAGTSVSHAGRMKSDRYFVWEEDDRDDLTADNRHAETAVTGYLDLYTIYEFDRWVDEIGTAFNDAGILWEMTGTTWEPNTGLFHHSWDWTVV